jgi:cellulose synthase/poly-beta-1,6-N-acetylglucosamine synthase-like glycosyltransferase
MPKLIEVLLSAMSLALLVPAGVFFVEIAASLFGRSSNGPSTGRRPRISVLMPAHDEAAGIAASIRSIMPELAAGDRLIVIADNCSDETGSIARQAGAEVIVRENAELRGKGFALDFGLRDLSNDPPEVVIMIDADCSVAAGAIDRLARDCAASSRPVQGLYLMRAVPPAGSKMRIAEFAWLIKNHVRPAGLRRLGLPCQLMGTGMAFPWACLQSISLASGNIVEDLQLGLDLAKSGTPPQFCPDALVLSTFPTSEEGVRTQRTRWEHGYLAVLFGQAPRLLLQAIVSGDLPLLAMTLDLIVPPIAFLTLVAGALWLLGLAQYSADHAMYPFGISTLGVALIAISVFLAWLKFGRATISLKDFANLIVYPIIKVPLYFRFVYRRQVNWVRSKRDS